MRGRVSVQLMTLILLAMPAGSATPADPKKIDWVDLKLDFDALDGQSVEIEGWLWLSGGSFAFSDRDERLDPIPADDSKLSRDERYHLMSKCSDRCRVTAIGLLRTVEEGKIVELTEILRPKIKPGKAPERKPIAANAGGTRIGVIELLLDFEDWKGRQVQVEGHLIVANLGEMLLLYQSRWNFNVLFVDYSKLSKDDMRTLLTRCNPRCSATFEGEPGEVLMQKGFLAAKLVK